MLMLSGLDSAKEEHRVVEQLFLERGLATFAVDGPGQGEAEYDLPIRADWSGPGKALLDALAAEPRIDGSRLGVWGVSLGGYYAPRVAAAGGTGSRRAWRWPARTTSATAGAACPS
ncbi:alpha/beta hydrolase family protein [Nonomuraea rubra]|uniref:alpha/beta hydrolase family protein n=1 Tax=Nonomuraea rubra TaxID=46180 RepID=UPI003622407A